MSTPKVLNFSGLKDYFLDANEKNNTGYNADTISNTGEISVLETLTIQNITPEEIQEKFREETASITLDEETQIESSAETEERNESECALRSLQNRLEATQNNIDESINDSPFAKIEHFEDYNNEIPINYEPVEMKDEEDEESDKSSSDTSETYIDDRNLYKSELADNSKDAVPQVEATPDEILENAKKHGKPWILRFLKFYKKREAKKAREISKTSDIDNISNVVELLETQEAKELEMLNQLNKMEKAMNSVIDRKTTENAKSKDGDFIEIDGSLVYLDVDPINIRHCPKAESWRNYVMYN
jgi:hypothetical protein